VGADAEREVLVRLPVNGEYVAVGRDWRWSRTAAPMSIIITLPSDTVVP
jgi:hypothetical protein